MVPFDTLLQKIRENPQHYGMGSHSMNKKSLKSLIMFSNGYGLRYRQELWETATGLDYYEQFDVEKFKTLPKPDGYKDSIYGTNDWLPFFCFVFCYCDQLATTEEMRPLNSLDAISNIVRFSGSDEKAFDVFFELYFAYQKEKEEVGENFIDHFGEKYNETCRNRWKIPIPHNNPHNFEELQ